MGLYPGGIRFESVEKTLGEERTKVDGQRAGEKEDTNKQSTQTLTIRCQAELREGFKNPSNGSFPLRGGGGTPFSVNFFPLTFWPAVVR